MILLAQENYENWISELKDNNFIDKITGKKINEETLRLLDIQKAPYG